MLKIKPDDLKGFTKINLFSIANLIISEYKLNEVDNSTYTSFGLPISLGLMHMRILLNLNYSYSDNPWCILANNLFGLLDIISIIYWNLYSYIPKTVFFMENKILAIKMLNNFTEKNYCQEKRIEKIIDINDFNKWIKPYWTIDNEPYHGLRLYLPIKNSSFYTYNEYNPETNQLVLVDNNIYRLIKNHYKRI